MKNSLGECESTAWERGKSPLAVYILGDAVRKRLEPRGEQ